MLDPVSAITGNLNAFLDSLAASMKPALYEKTPEATLCFTGFDHPFGNMVLSHQGDPAAFSSLLERVEGWSSQNGNLPIALIILPPEETDSRSKWASDRKWIQIDSMPGMCVETGSEFTAGKPADGIEVRVADSEADLVAVTGILEQGYPVTPDTADFFMRGVDRTGKAGGGQFANFIAFADGQPAACSSVAIDGDSAGIYCVATLEAFRGRGLGTSVTRAAMQYAASRGVRLTLLHASDMGVSVYKRLGFREHCRLPAFGFGL